MRSAQRQVLRSLRRVREFIAANTPAGDPGKLGVQLAELDDVIGKMTELGAEQEAAVRLMAAETKRQATLRAELWDDEMQPVSRVAREIFGTSPGLEAALWLPRKNADSQALVSSALAMAEAAEPHRALFVAHGLAGEFVQQLRDAAARLQGALGARDTAERRRVTATAAAVLQAKRGRRAVRLLHAIMAPRLAGDADILAAWKSVRKVSAVPGGGAVAVDEEEATPVVKVA
jgi:hypothetical protein